MHQTSLPLCQANIHVATFLDGTQETTRREEWVAAQLKNRQNVKQVQAPYLAPSHHQVLRHVSKRGTPPPKVWWLAPCGLRSVLRLALRYPGLHHTDFV